ncbi:MAG: restriction endonuclease [Lysobacter sp.]
MASSLLIAFLVVVLVGGAATAYFWLVHRVRLETVAGLKIVAGMRWREFSQLVVDALRERGFQPEPPEKAAHRGHQSDLILNREGRSWLLACKQGLDYRITPAGIAEFSKAMRLNGAPAGLMATPGKVDPEARTHAGTAIELIEGRALWPMLKPLLPVSVRNSVDAESHALSLRYIALGWVAALALGVGVALLMPASVGQQGPASVATGGKPPRGKSGDNPATLAPAPLSEDEQREHVRAAVSDLPGIDRAVWTTRSTLLIQLEDDSDVDHFKRICTVVERYDDLRASRLQLQPVAGSQRAVRFLQCRVY